MRTAHLDLNDIVERSERLGMAPHEWLSIRDHRGNASRCHEHLELLHPSPEPPTAEEWRRAVLSTVVVDA